MVLLDGFLLVAVLGAGEEEAGVGGRADGAIAADPGDASQDARPVAAAVIDVLAFAAIKVVGLDQALVVPDVAEAGMAARAAEARVEDGDAHALAAKPGGPQGVEVEHLLDVLVQDARPGRVGGQGQGGQFLVQLRQRGLPGVHGRDTRDARQAREGVRLRGRGRDGDGVQPAEGVAEGIDLGTYRRDVLGTQGQVFPGGEGLAAARTPFQCGGVEFIGQRRACGGFFPEIDIIKGRLLGPGRGRPDEDYPKTNADVQKLRPNL